MFHVIKQTSEHIIVSTCDPCMKQCIKECGILPTVLEEVVYDYANETVNIKYEYIQHYCVKNSSTVNTYLLKIDNEYVNGKIIFLCCDLSIHQNSKKLHYFVIKGMSDNYAISYNKIYNSLELFNTFLHTNDNIENHFDENTCMPKAEHVIVNEENDVYEINQCDNTITVQITDKNTFKQVIMLISCIIEYFSQKISDG